ncbi:MAG: hypothetical protein PSX80_07510 [bacterium]|nr:hypothetical protein [bacterium]
MKADVPSPITSPMTLSTRPMKSDEIANAGEVLNKTVMTKNNTKGTVVSRIGVPIPTSFRFLPLASSAFVIPLVLTKSLILKRLLYKPRGFNSN